MSAEFTCVQRHEAVIVDRGGGRKITQLARLGEVNWSRVLSNQSTANVQVFGSECRKQAAQLAKIEPRRHELRIFRDSQVVWEGPITEVEYKRDRVTVKAADVVEYIAGTPLSKYWPNAEDGGTDNMLTRIEQILGHELRTPYTTRVGTVNRTFQRWEQLSPPANIYPLLDIRPSATLKTTAFTLPFEMTVGEHLLALSKVGLSFTAIGRSILIWDSNQQIGQVRPMSSADFGGDPSLYVTSAGYTAVQHVVGTPESGQAPTELINVGSAGTTDPYYGAWTNIETNSGEDDPDVDIEVALASQAARLYDERKVLPIEIGMPSGSSLRLGPYLTIDALVPGTDVPVTATMYGREVARMQRFSSIDVKETSAGEEIGGTLVTQGGGA